MRVLMTVGRYVLSGATIVIENLSDQFSKRGIEVSIGALTFRRIPPKSNYDFSTLPIYNLSKLMKFLDRFDIVHNHHPIINYLALISRRPFVYHYHGAPDFGRGYLFRFSMLCSVRIMNHMFSAVIAVSESGATELKRYFGLNNVNIIYNGVNTDRFRPGLEDRFRKGSPQFLFVGNLYGHKKLDELIFALKEVVKVYPKTHLLIVGAGQRHSRIKDLIAKLNFRDHVTLVGRVSDSDLPYYYSSCDVYVTASRYEVCPVPLMEAMASGKPVVASSIPPHMELLTKSKTGVTYAKGDLKDLSKKMMMAYEERNKYISNALLFAKKNDWSLVADQILKIYVEILDNQTG